MVKLIKPGPATRQLADVSHFQLSSEFSAIMAAAKFFANDKATFAW